MKIEKVEIKNLFGHKNIEWNLNEDINILSGINGVGKSSILDCIALLCTLGNYPKEYKHLVEEITIHFKGKYELKYLRVKESFNEIKNRAIKEDGFDELIASIKKDFKGNLSKVNKISIEAGITSAKKNGKKCSPDEILDNLDIQIVSTFDQLLNKDEDAIRTSEITSNEIQTELDWEIYQMQEEYLNYQVNIGKKIEALLNKSNKTSLSTEIEELYHKKQAFIEMINGLFAETGKQINSSDEDNRISFICKNGYKLSPYKLSSGEKQILIILLRSLLQNNKEVIYFMDEPEISLHIDWQKKLIRNVKTLNPNCQIVLASHSPAIVMDGWLSKVKNVQDLIRE